MSSHVEQIQTLLHAQGADFEAFKKDHFNRVKALEDEIKDLVLKSGRPAIGGAGDAHAPPAERKALEQAVRALLAGDSEKANRFFVEARR
jgi:hypothetical protein